MKTKITASEITRLSEVLNTTTNPSVRDKLQNLLYLMIRQYHAQLTENEEPVNESDSED